MEKKCEECVCREEIINEHIKKEMRLEKDITKLEREIAQARQGAFGFKIKKEETLWEGMSRNYNEFDDSSIQLNVQLARITKQLKNWRAHYAALRIEFANREQIGWWNPTIKQMCTLLQLVDDPVAYQHFNVAIFVSGEVVK